MIKVTLCENAAGALYIVRKRIRDGCGWGSPLSTGRGLMRRFVKLMPECNRLSFSDENV